MANYGAAIKRPFTDLKKLVIGIVLSWIPIVNLLSFGYGLKCAKSAMGKKFELPEWKDWGGLFVDGLKGVIISIVYMIPALIVMGVVVVSIFTVVPSLLRSIAEGVDPEIILTGLMGSLGVGSLVALLLILLAAYVLPSALMSFVSKDSFGAAFSFGEVFKKAFTVKYFVVWIVTVIYTIIVAILLGIILGILAVIPVIGMLIVLLIALLSTIPMGTIGFIIGVTCMTLFGEIYPDL